jgi:hypothetical protein
MDAEPAWGNVYGIVKDLDQQTVCLPYEWMPLGADTNGVIVSDPAFVQDTGNLDVITLCFPPAASPFTVTEICGGFGWDENSPSAQEIRIFPNPSNGRFSVDFAGASMNQCECSILDMGGRILLTGLQGRLTDKGMAFDLQNTLDAGIYCLKIVSSEAVFIQKLLVN